MLLNELGWMVELLVWVLSLMGIWRFFMVVFEFEEELLGVWFGECVFVVGGFVIVVVNLVVVVLFIGNYYVWVKYLELILLYVGL